MGFFGYLDYFAKALPVWGKYAPIIALTLGAMLGINEYANRRFKGRGFCSG